MSYVIKYGDYYLRNLTNSLGGMEMTVKLSKEIMRGYDNKEVADRIAKATGGTVKEIQDEVTNEEV